MKQLIMMVEFFLGEGMGHKFSQLTRFSHAIIPDEPWALITGLVGLSLGFGMLCLCSTESVTSRLFRWTFIIVQTLVFGIFSPLAYRFTYLNDGPDGVWWNDVLFVLVAASLVVLGMVRLRTVVR